MSRNERKIRKRAEALGLHVHSVKWEPLGQSFEMCGPEGGWLIWLDEDGFGGPIMGYNIGEALNNLDDEARYRAERE